MLLDQGAQGFLPGVQRPEPGVLAPQLLGFFLDLLAVALYSQDLALELFHSHLVLHLALLVLHPALLVLQHAQLVAGIASPIEHRQKLSPPRQR